MARWHAAVWLAAGGVGAAIGAFGCVNSTWVPSTREAPRMCSKAVAVSVEEGDALVLAGARDLGELVLEHRAVTRDLAAVAVKEAASHGGTHVVLGPVARHAETAQISPGTCTEGAGCTAPTTVPYTVTARAFRVLRLEPSAWGAVGSELRPTACSAAGGPG